MNDIVFVKGNIISKSGNHQVKELIAYASDEWNSITEHDQIHNKDLIITDKDVLMPYTILCASGEISSYGNSLSSMMSPTDVFRFFNEEITNLQKLNNQEIKTELVDILKRQIYIGVVGTMELFLCDFLYSMVLGYKVYFNRFCENTLQIVKLKKNSANEKDILNTVTKRILKNHYHRIEDINEIYKDILDIEFPSYEKLKKQIFARHSLVHRNGFPSKESKYLKVNNNMIDELITEVQMIVNHIMETKKLEIEKWLPNLTEK